VLIDEGVIEVDLVGPTDHTGASADEAELATQELVYTVTAAVAATGGDGALPVRILVDGEPAERIWGDIDLSDPIRRAPQLDVRQLVQINNPAQGAVVEPSFTVDGEAAVFEATLEWRILDSDSDVVRSGFATAAACCRFSQFELSLELEPGSYTVIVSETDPSNGEGRPPMSDTRDFTVE